MQPSVTRMSVRPYPMNFDYHLGGIEISNLVAEASRVFMATESVFKGHFPKNKILPGVMLVEYALFIAERYLRSTNSPFQLIEIKSAVFVSPVFPGHVVDCRCKFGVSEKASETQLEMRAVLSREGIDCAKVRCIYGSRV